LTTLAVIAGVIVLLIAAGAIYQIAARAIDRRRYPPPGRKIDLGHASVHLHQSGSGSPAVILEAGIAATSLSWRLVQDEVAKFATVVSYDRLGLGWSDPLGRARSLEHVSEELYLMLAAARIPGPWIFVGHSYGGMVGLWFTRDHLSKLAGMVLVDPQPAPEWAPITEKQRWMINRAVRLSRRGALLARFGVVRASLSLLLAGAHKLPGRVARVSSGGPASSLLADLAGQAGKLPRELWPMVASHWSDPKAFLGMAAYLDALPETAEKLLELPNLGDLPLIVLSAANTWPARLAEHQRIANLSSRGELRTVPDSGHWILLDRPDAVIQAIRDVAAAPEHLLSSSVSHKIPEQAVQGRDQ
jgi:pimeloyl-ACP methyl ester carboxylesterase